MGNAVAAETSAAATMARSHSSLLGPPKVPTPAPAEPLRAAEAYTSPDEERELVRPRRGLWARLRGD